MKKILFFITMMVLSIGLAQAQGKAEIKFDKTTHDLRNVLGKQSYCELHFQVFTNIGDAPLVIHQAVAIFLRMYRTRIYPGTYHAGKNRYNQGDLQRNG